LASLYFLPISSSKETVLNPQSRARRREGLGREDQALRSVERHLPILVSAYREGSDVALDLDLGSLGIRQSPSSIRRLGASPLRPTPKASLYF
jgi:hypothetical protein